MTQGSEFGAEREWEGIIEFHLDYRNTLQNSFSAGSLFPILANVTYGFQNNLLVP